MGLVFQRGVLYGYLRLFSGLVLLERVCGCEFKRRAGLENWRMGRLSKVYSRNGGVGRWVVICVFSISR